ncbi:SirB2 family protein [Planctobacterium marinum]|uniref:SirB2 family protein n=1 Tax=Planctobacterium marinum TaxID=1631968 RepID=UPI001E479A28|nr:SirB2 family protein [Planctobacterium marinum]MCC2604322.1 SirB2 family protein [Planctobacterium marinum]
MVKHIHMTAIAVSFLLLVLRFIWVMSNSGMMSKKWVKVVPHVIDTVLLASAITLCILLAQYPLYNGWLTEKVIGLIAYILLGLFALKLGKNKVIKSVAFVGAVAVFAMIGKIAVTKQAFIF